MVSLRKIVGRFSKPSERRKKGRRDGICRLSKNMLYREHNEKNG
jgi:hypothetical protein